MNNKVERYYDIKGMFKYAVSNVKMLIIVLVVGALLGVGFCAVTKNALITQESTIKGTQDAIDEAKGTLSATRVSETEDAYSTYKTLSKQRTYLQKYIKNSIYLNLDESSAKSNSIVFSIDGNKKSSAIVSSYIHLMKSNDLFTSINKSLKLNIESAYLSELIDINEGNETNSVTVNTENNNNNDRSFIVTVVGKNDTQCKAITQCVKNRMNKLTSSLKKSFGSFNISNSGDTYEPIVGNDITSRRMNYNDRLSSVETAITNLSNALNDDQKVYLAALIDNNAGVSNKVTVKTQFNYSALIMNAVEGAVLLFLLCIIIRIVKYMLDQKIHTEKEFINYFGLNVIADAQDNSKIDENVITEEINFISKKSNNEKIGLLSSLVDNNFENTIYQRLRDNNVNCEIVSSAPESKDDFDKLLSVGKVVIFEKLGSSNLRNVEKMLRYYELKNIEVIGAILIK